MPPVESVVPGVTLGEGWLWRCGCASYGVSTLWSQAVVMVVASVSGYGSGVVLFPYSHCSDVYVLPPHSRKQDAPLVLCPPDLFAKGA